MAEIKIEKKKPIWPWILLILILLAAVYYFWYYNERQINNDEVILTDTISQIDESYRVQDEVEANQSRPLYTGTYGTVRDEQEFADYLVYVDKLDNNSEQNDYYQTAFSKLINATKRAAEIENVDVSKNISAARESAEKIGNDSKTTTKADNIKKAANEVSMALKSIQQKKSTGFAEDVNGMETTVVAIDGSKTIDNQTSNIDAFFDKTAKLFEKMYQTQNNY